jgi:O-antigen/teichoic acid export membrane protein
MKKNYIYNLILSVFNILFPILSFPYASHTLGPVGIGKVQFISSFTQYFVMIASLGIPIYGSREIAKYKDDKVRQSKVFSELFGISFVMSTALTLIYLIVIIYFPFFKADKGLYIIAATSIFFNFSSIDWLYIGLQEFKMITLRSVGVKLLSLGCLYLMVKSEGDVLIYLCLIIFSGLANSIINFMVVGKKIRFSFRQLNIKQHFSPMLLIFGMAIATSLYTILDVVLLGFLSDDKAVGLYTAAVKLTKIIIPFLTSMGAVLTPTIVKHFADRDYDEIQNLLNKTFHFTVFFAIPAVFGLALLAPEFIYIFSGKQFMEGVVSMQILAVLPLTIGFASIWGFLILNPSNKDKEVLYAVIAGMVTCVVLNVLLVPQLRDRGAALANVGTELIVLTGFIYYTNRSYKFVFSWNLLFKAILSAVVFIPAVYLIKLQTQNYVYTLVTSVFCCAILYFSIQFFVFKDQLVAQFAGKITQFFKLSTEK